MDTTLNDSIDNTASHALGVRNDNASEANIHHFLPSFMGGVDERDQVIRWRPLLGSDLSII